MPRTARPPFQNRHQYAIDQEVMRQNDAIHWYGEMVACVMLWCIDDLEAGLVERCSECYLLMGDIADAYGQTPRRWCLNCYGTTFEGGIRALVYRPAIIQVDEISEDVKRHGHVEASSARIELTSDFLMRDGDWVVRSDDTRWRISRPQTSKIVTGFGPHAVDDIRSSVTAVLEEGTSIAYEVPILSEPLQLSGWNPAMLYPRFDIVNAYLIPNVPIGDEEYVIDGDFDTGIIIDGGGAG